MRSRGIGPGLELHLKARSMAIPRIAVHELNLCLFRGTLGAEVYTGEPGGYDGSNL